jgi:hypothetical protein
MSDKEWTRPTMADAGTTNAVRCRCGRIRGPTEMLEVRALGVGTDFLCSACVEDLFRKGVVDRPTLYRRTQAPADWLLAYEAKLLWGPLVRSGLPRENWGEVLAVALDEAAALAALPSWVPQTEAPSPGTSPSTGVMGG